MLLAIPGDNTYSNYQEATRTFWRQTVLPLVNRTAKALSAWLAPAFSDASPTNAASSTNPALSLSKRGTALDLRPDLDAIEALSTEREALWSRIDKATFLTANEKRSAVGYGPLEEGGNAISQKYSPNQPRVPAGQSGGGQWTNGEGGDGPDPASTTGSKPIQLAQVGGASTMTDIGPTAGPYLGATLLAPQGQSLGTFAVSPLTNNVYQTPLGPVDVTGWTAYYGPPGSELGGQTYSDAVLWFVNPTRTRTHLERVSPGM
jgi:hypothetical protein